MSKALDQDMKFIIDLLRAVSATEAPLNGLAAEVPGIDNPWELRVKASTVLANMAGELFDDEEVPQLHYEIVTYTDDSDGFEQQINRLAEQGYEVVISNVSTYVKQDEYCVYYALMAREVG